jgi:hypothetical protein
MTTPLTPQQLDEIEQRANAATPGPWTTDGWEIYQGGGSSAPDLMAWAGETCRADDYDGSRNDADFIAHARTDVPALLAEIRRLRAEVADFKEAQRLDWVHGQDRNPHTPRLCECGHSSHAHTVPSPHSCFAFGRTCPCQAYRQLPHDEAVAQLDRNLRAADERRKAQR